MRQQGNEKTFTWDDPAIMLGLFVMFYAGVWAAWYFGHEHIAKAYGYVRYVQFWLIYALGHFVDIPGISHMHEWLVDLCAPDGLAGRCARPFAEVQWSEISRSSIWVNVFCLIVMIGLNVKRFKHLIANHPAARFTRKHNLKTFVDENKVQYPHLRLFSRFDLIEQPLDDADFGMSLTGRQFAYRHQLIAGWEEEVDGTFTPTLDRKAAALVFRGQMGKHWVGVDHLTPGELLLIAIAIPRVAATNTELSNDAFALAMKDCDAMIRWCWDHFSPNENQKFTSDADIVAWMKRDADLTVPKAMIRKYLAQTKDAEGKLVPSHPLVVQLLMKHAYVRTIIIAMYVQARRLGVLPPAEMRWLRFFDRNLWYLLQNIGRQAPYAEGAGPFAHWLYEVKSRESLPEPQIDKAVTALEQVLRSTKYEAKDKLAYERGCKSARQIAAVVTPVTGSSVIESPDISP